MGSPTGVGYAASNLFPADSQETLGYSSATIRRLTTKPATDCGGILEQSTKKGPMRRIRMSHRVARVPLLIFAALILSVLGVSFASNVSAQDESTPTSGVLGT